MDNMAYLQQISATSKPGGKKKFSLKNLNISPVVLIIIAVAIVVLIGGIAIFNMLNTVDEKDKDLSIQTEVRITNLITIMDTFEKELKNSSLRSMSSSLRNVISETDLEITAIILNDFGVKKQDIKKLPIFAEESPLQAELYGTLENARISGHLDRVYTREFTLEIVKLMSLQSEIIERTEITELQDILTKANTDLQSLQVQFADYSDYSN